MESFRDHITFLEKTAIRLRMKMLEMTHNSGTGNTGSSLSAMDLLVTLYYGKLHDQPLMKFEVDKPGSEDQDYVILSKSQACPSLYAILSDRGFFDSGELDYFSQVGSLLQGHPLKKIPGVSIGSGLPGQGLSSAVGLAMALKMDKQPNQVFCLFGEGELQEGQIWEAAMSAAHYKLDNLIALVDYNDLQVDGTTRAVMNIDPLADKFEAFGWKTIPVRAGHNYEELLYAFERAKDVQRRLVVIIARTIKGKGVHFAENKSSYQTAFSEQEMAEALSKLQLELRNLEGAISSQ